MITDTDLVELVAKWRLHFSKAWPSSNEEERKMQLKLIARDCVELAGDGKTLFAWFDAFIASRRSGQYTNWGAFCQFMRKQRSTVGERERSAKTYVSQETAREQQSRKAAVEKEWQAQLERDFNALPPATQEKVRLAAIERMPNALLRKYVERKGITSFYLARHVRAVMDGAPPLGDGETVMDVPEDEIPF
jgi:hypothetical protein